MTIVALNRILRKNTHTLNNKEYNIEMTMNKKCVKKTQHYESPLIQKMEVELEQVIATSGKARVKVSVEGGSKEETWDDTGFGGNYDIYI